MEDNIDDVTWDHKESLASQHAGPGIMLLTASMRLLYKDRRAGELCQQIIRYQNGKAANGVLPQAVASLVDQIRKTLKVRTDPKDWEQIQPSCVVNTLHSSVLLCGTALIEKTNAETQILIVMNETGISAWQDNVIVQAKGLMIDDIRAIMRFGASPVPKHHKTHHDLMIYGRFASPHRRLTPITRRPIPQVSNGLHSRGRSVGVKELER